MNLLETLEDRLVFERLVIGLEEPVLIKGLGKLIAKIDSGNSGYNVLDGRDFQLEGDMLNFTTVNKDGQDKRVQYKVVEYIDVNIGGGNIQHRPVIELDIKFGNKEYEKIKFSVTDRHDNSSPILICKGFVENELDALIDVGAKNISSKDKQAEIVSEGIKSTFKKIGSGLSNMTDRMKAIRTNQGFGTGGSSSGDSLDKSKADKSAGKDSFSKKFKDTEFVQIGTTLRDVRVNDHKLINKAFMDFAKDKNIKLSNKLYDKYGSNNPLYLASNHYFVLTYMGHYAKNGDDKDFSNQYVVNSQQEQISAYRRIQQKASQISSASQTNESLIYEDVQTGTNGQNNQTQIQANTSQVQNTAQTENRDSADNQFDFQTVEEWKETFPLRKYFIAYVATDLTEQQFNTSSGIPGSQGIFGDMAKDGTFDSALSNNFDIKKFAPIGQKIKDQFDKNDKLSENNFMIAVCFGDAKNRQCQLITEKDSFIIKPLEEQSNPALDQVFQNLNQQIDNLLSQIDNSVQQDENNSAIDGLDEQIDQLLNLISNASESSDNNVIDDLNQQIDELFDMLNNNATSISDNIIDNLNQQIDELFDMLTNRGEDETDNSIDNLNQQIDELFDLLTDNNSDTPDYSLDNLTENIDELFNNLIGEESDDDVSSIMTNGFNELKDIFKNNYI